jgi:hypothetical protein
MQKSFSKTISGKINDQSTLKKLGPGWPKKGNSSMALVQPKHAPFLGCGENPDPPLIFHYFENQAQDSPLLGKPVQIILLRPGKLADVNDLVKDKIYTSIRRSCVF